MNQDQVELTVKVNGRAVAEYSKDGKTFIEGRAGTAYTLFVRNTSPYRVMAVPSVDGINVLTGKPATGTKSDGGYVLDPGESYNVDGYRLSNEQVAAIIFTGKENAYAEKDKGLEGTAGVIGLRVWREKVAPPPAPSPIIIERYHHHDRWYRDWNWPWGWPNPNYPGWTYDPGLVSPSWTCGGSSYGINTVMNCSSLARAQGAGSNVLRASSMQCSVAPQDAQPDSSPFDLGSTFGARLESKVREVTFECDNLLTEATIYYATRAGLEALGIDLTRAKKVAFPQAFNGYCTPPVNWKG